MEANKESGIKLDKERRRSGRDSGIKSGRERGMRSCCKRGTKSGREIN